MQPNQPTWQVPSFFHRRRARIYPITINIRPRQGSRTVLADGCSRKPSNPLSAPTSPRPSPSSYASPISISASPAWRSWPWRASPSTMGGKSVDALLARELLDVVSPLRLPRRRHPRLHRGASVAAVGLAPHANRESAQDSRRSRMRIIVGRCRLLESGTGSAGVSMSCRVSKNEGLAPLIFPFPTPSLSPLTNIGVTRLL